MTRLWATVGMVFVSVFGALAVGVGAQTNDSRLTASPAASPIACPVTQPNGNQPPATANVFGRGNGDFGNAYLWTSLWIWGDGVVLVPPGHVRPDGSLGGMKWAWYRYIPGDLTIDGRRLDAPAPPLRAEVPEGYGDEGFLPSGLIFPTEGCWEVTGHLGGGSLTFVVLVVKLDETATPAATAAA